MEKCFEFESGISDGGRETSHDDAAGFGGQEVAVHERDGD
jgi:hypothetical protein